MLAVHSNQQQSAGLVSSRVTQWIQSERPLASRRCRRADQPKLSHNPTKPKLIEGRRLYECIYSVRSLYPSLKLIPGTTRLLTPCLLGYRGDILRNTADNHVTFEKGKQIRGSRVRFRRSGVGGAVGCLRRLDEIQARVPRRRLCPMPRSCRHFRPVLTMVILAK